MQIILMNINEVDGKIKYLNAPKEQNSQGQVN